LDANQVIDARAGLSPAARDALRNAEQVSLAVKDASTAVLGAWHTASSAPTLVLIHASDKWGRHTPAEPVPTLHVRDARHDLWWRTAIEACRSGDILVVWWWGNQLSLELATTFPVARNVSPRSRPPMIVAVTARPERATNFLLATGLHMRCRPRVGDTTIIHRMVPPD
jgi:hypothetical protein